eukprot:Partr_v1_DN28671_c1_g2_i1_m49517 putative Myosin VIIA
MMDKSSRISRRITRHIAIPEAGLSALREAKSPGDPIDDLLDLPASIDLNPLELAHVLKYRAERGDLYTNIDSSYMLAVNSYTPLDIYSDSYVESYGNADTNDVFPPHVFDVAEQAYRNMLKDSSSQSIIVTGRHGSGKTFTSMQLWNYLVKRTTNVNVALASLPQSQMSIICEKLMARQTVVEAFGSYWEETDRSCSGIGFMHTLMFDTEGTISGAKNSPVGIDTERIVKQAGSESTYIIFLSLVDSKLFADLLNGYNIKVSEFDYIGNSGKYSCPDLENVRQALLLNGIPLQRQEEIFELLSAILVLGNIRFTADSHEVRVHPLSLRLVKSVAAMLKISESNLRKYLTDSSPSTSASANSKAAIAARDVLAKSLYRRIVSRLFDSLNGANFSENNHCISILDLPGYRSSTSLDTFKCNYANEALHSLRNQILFVEEQREYEDDGIAWDPVSFRNNFAVVQMLSGPEVTDLTRSVAPPRDKTSIAGLLNPGTSASQKYTLKDFISGMQELSEKAPVKINSISGMCQIEHFWGLAHYNMEAVFNENFEPLRFNVIPLLQLSENSFLAEAVALAALLDDMDCIDPSLPATSLSRFIVLLQKCLQTVSSAIPWFLECIASNADGVADYFDEDFVAKHLAELNAAELIKMRKTSYPVRMSFTGFYATYELLLKKKRNLHRNMTITDLQPKCVDILQVSLEGLEEIQSGPAYQIGLHHLYLTATTHAILEYSLNLKLNNVATDIQRVWRGYQTRLNVKKSRPSSGRIVQSKRYTRKQVLTEEYLKLKSIDIETARIPSLLPKRKTIESKANQQTAWDILDLPEDTEKDSYELEVEIEDWILWACSIMEIENPLPNSDVIDAFVKLICDGRFLIRLATIIYPNLPSVEELVRDISDAEDALSLFLDVCEQFAEISETDLFEIDDVLGEANPRQVIKTLALFRDSILPPMPTQPAPEVPAAMPRQAHIASKRPSQATRHQNMRNIRPDSTLRPVDVTNLSTLTDNRRALLSDFLEQEFQYISKLKIIVEFRRYIAGRKNVLHPLELKTLFCNIEEVLDFHEEYVFKPLDNVLSTGSAQAVLTFEIGGMFNNLTSNDNIIGFPKLQGIYEKYFNSAPASQRFLKNTKSGILRSYLDLFFKSADMGNGVGLSDFLMIPLYRTDIHLTNLKSIDQNTSSDQLDKYNLQQIITKLKDLSLTAALKREEINLILRPEPLQVTPIRAQPAASGSDAMRKSSLGQVSTASTAIDPAHTNILHDMQLISDGIRRFLCKGSVWEVINTNLVKERSLFLFTDMLIIAKEIKSNEEVQSAVGPEIQQSKFVAKTIIHLPSVSLKLERDDDPYEALQGTPVMNKGLLKFERNPKEGITYFIQKNLLSPNPNSVAQFLFRTSSLNSRQLGRFIGSGENRDILVAYLSCFDFSAMRVDEALRLFLGQFRLPGEPKTIDRILEAFSARYFASNPDAIKSVDLILKLVFATLMLNADIHRRSEDRLSTTIMTEKDYIMKFRQHDPAKFVLDQTLSDIFNSVLVERIGIATNGDDSEVDLIPIEFGKPPFRITVREYSLPVTVTIPKIDPHLIIKIFPQVGVKCFPSVLQFTESNSASFRLMGSDIGRHGVSYLKTGKRAHLYSSKAIPFGKPLVVEPPFMKHVFQIKARKKNAQTGRKVSYMFSVANASQRDNWVQQIESASQSEFSTEDIGLSLENGSGAGIVNDFVCGTGGAVIIPVDAKLSLKRQ